MEKCIEKNKSYDDIINHFNKLDSSRENKKYTDDGENKLNNSFYEKYMGLSKGKIQDIEVQNDKIKILVGKNNSTHKFNIKTTGKYNEENEFARLLNFYNIDTSSPSKLFGKKVLLRHNINGWEIYIPDKLTNKMNAKSKLDIIARCFGYHQLDRTRKYPAEIYAGMLIVISVSITFSTILYNIIQFSTVNDISMWIFVFLILVTPFITSVLSRFNKMYYNTHK